MGFNNLIQLSFSEEELTQLNAAFAEINTILKAKSIPHLTPSERQKYGRDISVRSTASLQDDQAARGRRD